MRKIVCDKCGEELGIRSVIPTYVEYLAKEVDLCSGCKHKFETAMKQAEINFFKEATT